MKGTEVNLDVIMISYINLVSGLLHQFLLIMITSKHVIGMYTFTNVCKHVFKIRMCLIFT